jgi:hypothetical protein
VALTNLFNFGIGKPKESMRLERDTLSGLKEKRGQDDYSAMASFSITTFKCAVTSL